jgi:HEAT repeat protein
MNVLLDASAPRSARLQAARTLGKSKFPHSMDTLLQVLDTRDLELREEALQSLRALGAVEALQSRLTDSKQPASARRAAARGLRFLKDASAVPALITALEDSSAEVRAEAALALSAFNPASAQEPLITALDDPNDEVRYYAALALGSVSTPRVKSALQARKAVEKDETVLYALTTALKKLESTEPKAP